MASADGKPNTSKGSMRKPVIHRPKHDKNRDISQEPEIKELEAMIERGELDRERTVEYIRNDGIERKKRIKEDAS